MLHVIARSALASACLVTTRASGDGASTRKIEPPVVEIMRLPEGGVQPQAVVGADGSINVIYLAGDPAASNVFFMRSTDGGRTFAKPIRVNSTPGSAVAAGTIRGAHLALGRDGRIHIAWNGSMQTHSGGDPQAGGSLLYTRSNEDATAFEPERAMAIRGLDGGGSIAASDAGQVSIVWHAPPSGKTGEQARRIWLSRSGDDGETFDEPVAIDAPPRGACACCSLRAFMTAAGDLFVLYRTAATPSDRDMTLIRVHAEEIDLNLIEPWPIGQCVMSSASFVETGDGVLGAWETKRRIRFASLPGQSDDSSTEIIEPAGQGDNAKHPVLAVNREGAILCAWTENTGWAQGGDIAWQVFEPSGAPIESAAGRAPRLPVWGSPAAFARDDGTFVILY